jgi:tetratricopeptide (TPR) repeat protein
MKRPQQAKKRSLLKRLPNIIGRQDFLVHIRKAIGNRSRQPHVLYFVGPGGIGKTRLLEEVGNLQESIEKPFLWSGIIDLYHEENHSPDIFIEAVAKKLDPSEKYFHVFWERRREFLEKRRQGFSGVELEKLRERAKDQFVQEYKALAAKNRVVLCIDTMELIQYESDVVQKICKVEDEDTVIKNFLINLIIEMPNTVTILAGRPRNKVQDTFKRALENSKVDFQLYKLNAFSEHETQRYLNEMIEKHPELEKLLEPTEKTYTYIFQMGQGRPIRLALCLDLVRFGGRLPDPDSDTLDSDLVNNLRNLPGELGATIDRYLFAARKGLDEELLSALSGWSKKKCRRLFELLREMEIVKRRPDTNQLFLHDEIYDLVDEEFKDKAGFGREDFGGLTKYYLERLATAQPKERNNLTVNLLYYQFQVNAYKGYFRYYAQLDEDAIRTHEIGLDMRLRDEALRFIDRYTNAKSPFYAPRVKDAVDRATIDRDCAVRWIKRYIARGEFRKASQIAENVRKSTKNGFVWEEVNDHPLYKPSLLTAWAEALAYSGAPEDAVREKLEQAIELLNGIQDLDEDQTWWKVRTLGTAYNRLGYVHRIYGRYGSALKYYKLALPLFSKGNMREERANVLNNMAFSSALLGRSIVARNTVVEAIKVRQELDKKYPLALSYNTRGRIHVLDDHPMWGEQDCRSALRIFEELKDSRGIGLARVGIGLTLRKRGDQWKLGVYSTAQAERFFREAVKQLTQAVDVFVRDVFEPIQLWEAYNELGSVFCDWGWLIRNQKGRLSGQIGSQVLEKYKQSIHYQKKALKVAESHKLYFQMVDSFDDLAQAYADQSFLLYDLGRSTEAKTSLGIASSYLDKVDGLVPEEYHLQPGIGFSPSAEREPGEAYWLALGKMRLQRGLWLFETLRRGHKLSKEQQEHAMRVGIQHFAFATAYFQQYWPQSHAFEDGVNAAARRLQRIGVPLSFARQHVETVTDEYLVNLDSLLKAIEDVLLF